MAATYAIDTRWVEYPATGGTKTYIESLAKALLAIDQEDKFHFWGSPLEVGSTNSHVDPFGGWYRRAWQLSWKTFGTPPLDWMRPKPDVWHFTNYVAPPTKRPFVVTVHDLTFLEHPDYVEPKNLDYLTKFVPETLQAASKILAVSEFTAEAIAEHFPREKEKIITTPLGCEERFFEPTTREDISLVKDTYSIDGEYLLSVGTLEPRKNLRTLLLAFAAIRRHTTEQLVVVGNQGWLFDETQQLLEKLGLGSRVVLTGAVSDRDLRALYAGAKTFVFPSHYEGFGIPVLEAMAAGAPVLASSAASLPEVGGGSALYFDPEDTEALGNALRRLLEDAPLRQRLSSAGRERAKQFTWRETAEKTLRAYRAAGLEGNDDRRR